MIRRLRAVAETRSIGQPEPASLRLFLRDLESLLSPDPFHSRVVHVPAFLMKPRRDPPIPVPPILAGEDDDARPQGVLVIRLTGDILLRGPALPHHSARPAF
jgi:hypothetical protein